MNVKEEYICRLCLNVADKEFELIDEFTTKMFDILLLRVNLDISKDPIICKDCMGIVKKCFNFKTACIDTEEIIFSSAIGKNGATFELNDMHKNQNDIEAVDGDFICRFCTSHLRENNFTLLDTLMKDAIIARMLQVLMPKMDMNIIKNPVICTSCTHNLMCYIKLVETCLGIEEKISKYFQTKGNSSDNKVKLGDILHFLEQDNCEYIQTYKIKQEIETLDDKEEAHSEVYCDELIKPEEDIDIKDEEVNFNESACETSSDIPVYKYDTSMVKTEDKSTNYMVTNKDASGGENRITIRTSKAEHNDLIRHKCTMCAYKTQFNSSLKSHMLIHKDVTEVEMNKCPICTFQTKRKGDLKRHMVIHKDDTEVEMHKCPLCTFKTKHKKSIKGHMLTHKDITEVQTYKCFKCTYETKDKRNIIKHMLIHKDVTEIEMHKCSVCSFRTKRKKSLQGHMLVHKDVSEVEMFKCSMCTYEVKRKDQLKSHMRVHKDVTEVEMYKCSMCTYETKDKRSLRRHTLVHKDVTEVEMYKCTVCTYQTKHKGCIKAHIKRHEC